MINAPDARDLKAAVTLNEEELTRYVTALTLGDAASVSAIEERNAIHRQGGAPWFDVAKKIWVREPVWEYRERMLLSDADIGPRITGRPGPFKVEISKTTGRPILFGSVYSVDITPPLAWGLLMLFRRADILAFIKNATDWHTFVITQPDRAASDARIGGLRPVARITDTMPSPVEIG